MMTRGVILSIILHIVIVVIAVFGLPELFEKPVQDEHIITVELLPVSSVTNIKPQKLLQIKQPPNKPSPPPRPEIIKEKPAPEPIPQAKILKPVPEKIKDVISLTKAPMPKPDIKPKVPKRPQVAKKPPPQKIDKVIKKVKKPAPPAPIDPFDALEKNLDDLAKAKSQTTTLDDIEKSLTQTNKLHNPMIALSLSESDAIIQQFYNCWTPPLGVRDLENMSATIHVLLQRDGVVVSAELVPVSSSNSDGFYRVFVESTLRAIQKCSPLQHLPPPAKYDSWKDIELTFNPKNMY